MLVYATWQGEKMVFWCRIKQKKLISLPNQFKRCYLHVPRPCLANHTASNTRIWVLENPPSIIRKTQFEFANNARFFAAPVQAKPKQEERDTSGPRLNDKIKVEFVRLVTEEGHCVVSRREALERAKRLDLDLVEVQRNAKPPVCKIMDYHKEKYKQQVKDKDRSKSKSEVTLRKGDCKEVRFSGKTEQKDLQMKADMVRRLMERGYRVKCMAMGTEDQDLGGFLSRLSSLIEDVSLVECGPRVEKKQAFVIVRHVKFGPPKKGPAKKPSQVVGIASPDVQTVASSPLMVNPSMLNQSPIQFEETVNLESEEDEILSDEADTLVPPSMKMPDKDIGKKNPTWSVVDASDDLNSVFDFGDEAKVEQCSGDVQMNSAPEKISSATNNFSDFVRPRPVVDSTRTENGYRMELRNNYPPAKSMNGKGTSARDSFERLVGIFYVQTLKHPEEQFIRKFSNIKLFPSHLCLFPLSVIPVTQPLPLSTEIKTRLKKCKFQQNGIHQIPVAHACFSLASYQVHRLLRVFRQGEGENNDK